MRLATMTNVEYLRQEIEDDLATRARGLSYWHWVFFKNGKGYGFYNTRAQALKAREQTSAKGNSR